MGETKVVDEGLITQGYNLKRLSPSLSLLSEAHGLSNGDRVIS